MVFFRCKIVFSWYKIKKLTLKYILFFFVYNFLQNYFFENQ